MKKLLHIIDFLGVGGAEKLLVSVINGLNGKVEQHLIVLGPPVPLLEDLPASCKTTVLGFKSYSDLWTIHRFVKQYIRKQGIEIVHSQLYWSNMIARTSAGKHVKVFNSIQAISSEASYKLNRLTLYLEKLTYRKRHHIIGVSGEVLNDFDKWVGLKGPSSILYNMIDDKFFAVKPKTEYSNIGLRLVAVGNLRLQKNYPYALEAFKKMPAEVSLDIYGEGDLRNEFQAVIDRYKLNIRLCGHNHELEKVLPTYDMVLMCSLYEGFSLGLMEAMACGLPPIISDVPVLREAGGEDATYIDLKDPDDLVKKVNSLLANKSQLPVLAAKAHQRALTLAKKESHLGKLMQLYSL